MTANDQRPELRPDEDGESPVDSSREQRRWRPPAHHVRVCVLSTCETQEGELARALEQRLGIGLDERTADGTALEGLECIGLCGIKQAVLVDDEPIIGRNAVLAAVGRLVR